MRIILIHDMSSEYGGAEKVFHRCISAACEANHDVTVMVGDDGAAIRRLYPGVRLIALNQKPLRVGATPSDLFLKTYNRRAMTALRTEIERDPDDTVVHIHGWMQILSPSIFYAVAKANTPTLVTAHDFFLSCPNGGFVNFNTGDVCRLKPLSFSCLSVNCDKHHYVQKLWRYQRMLVQKAAGHDFWSRLTAILVHEKMAAFFPENTFGSSTILRTPTTPFVPWKVDVRQNKTITFLGRMALEKGVDRLVTAVKSLPHKTSFLGAGPLLEHVRAECSDAYVPGWVDDADLPDLLSQSRVFVMPSRMPEPYGLVAVEAMMSGIPVIVGQNCLIADEIKSSGAGIVVDIDDTPAFAEAMDRIVRDDDYAVKLSERAYEVGNAFAPAPEEWASRMNCIYSKAIKGGNIASSESAVGHKPIHPAGNERAGQFVK